MNNGQAVVKETPAQELERLRRENAALRKTNETALSLKVSEKKALSVGGLGRFPVTLYAPQWIKLLAIQDRIHSFIEAHKDELSWEKGDKAGE